MVMMVTTLTVICAIRARHQLLVRALEWEPGLEVVLLGRSQIECARDNGDDAVGQAQALVEGFRRRHHRFEHLPRLFGISDAELFDLFELMDTKDAPHVPAGRASFFSEAG